MRERELERPVGRSELIVAANRGPASLRLDDSGEIVVGHPAGGLAPSLARALSGRGALWIAAAMNPAERHVAASGSLAEAEGGIALDFVDLDEATIAAAYNVVANSTLWFLHHGMFDLVHRPVLDARWHRAWEHYVAYNRAFATRIAERAADGAIVVVHDYHLALVGSWLVEQRPDLRTVHFSHTPFAAPEELAVLPESVRTTLLSGMASFGAVGFHTDRWRDRFVRCAAEVVDSLPVHFTTPLGSDAAELASECAGEEFEHAAAALRDRTGGRRLIVRSDRVEPSKNLLRGFLAFEELLEAEPSLVGEVVFVARAYASRTGLSEYLAYRVETEQLVGRINARFAGAAGGPVILLDVGDDYPASLAALAAYDALLVNPIRDGMNLVAKEGPILNRAGGGLALSREAGAFEELGDACEAVEPFDVTGTAAALHRALTVDAGLRRERGATLAAIASSMPPARWLDELIGQAVVASPSRS